ncbi:DUF3472 domain-containing protein [Zhouia spongiae]|uniref:DUF3472 domain-containing protein n=1 Tax=Zhouia spongiae TaxID=2202721 RepID=A0ABY3YI44_9FLAO|nr:DUF3472 domain-containing protein [Zhouia spongiae]UNY97307.1 DUF3472 domain-containing protein [Zhouia spongiae]
MKGFNKYILLNVFLLALVFSCQPHSEEIVSYMHGVPTVGNSWVVNKPEQNRLMITEEGIKNWSDREAVIRTYFRTDSIGELSVALLCRSQANSKLKVSVDDQVLNVSLNNREWDSIAVGTFKIEKPGYHHIEIQGIQTEDTEFGEIRKFLLGGTAVKGAVTYVKEDFYWGRRGPSVHLTYEVPENKDIRWFYNEISVPEGEDVIGSYFMANGFGEGYFGMQVNSATERRFLFSVWSPYNTQNPKDIPEEYRITLLGKGEGVTTGEFGNEGSGGQSYKVFNWKAGHTYKFLLKAEPSENNSTDYTAYIYTPEEEQWKLIAGFRRPKTATYIKRPHSFLENFRTEAGYVSRMGYYSNQWVQDTEGIWYELTKARFTADATARKGSRLDYAGGSDGNRFFMKNCGFFSGHTQIDTFHEREATGNQPEIDFSGLETPLLN